MDENIKSKQLLNKPTFKLSDIEHLLQMKNNHQSPTLRSTSQTPKRKDVDTGFANVTPLRRIGDRLSKQKTNAQTHRASTNVKLPKPRKMQSNSPYNKDLNKRGRSKLSINNIQLDERQNLDTSEMQEIRLTPRLQALENGHGTSTGDKIISINQKWATSLKQSVATNEK